MKVKVELTDIFKKQIDLLKRDMVISNRSNMFEDLLQRYADIYEKTAIPFFLCVPEPFLMQRLIRQASKIDQY